MIRYSRAPRRAFVPLAAHIHAATQRFHMLIADFDRRRGWELHDHTARAHGSGLEALQPLGRGRPGAAAP